MYLVNVSLPASSWDGVNLTPIFIFGTYGYRFHSTNTRNRDAWQSLSRFGESRTDRLHAIDKSYIDRIKSRIP